MTDEGIPGKVGSHGGSVSVNLPKAIVEKLGLTIGSSVTFRIEGDIITLHKTDSSLPIDLLTNDVLDLMTSVRELSASHLEIEENYLKDLDHKNRVHKLNDLLVKEKVLHADFERLKKELQHIFDSIMEPFHLPELKKLEDIFKLGKHLNVATGTDSDSILEFMLELKRAQDKYLKLAEKAKLLAQDKKISDNDATEISKEFLKEAERCRDMLKKIADTAAASL